MKNSSLIAALLLLLTGCGTTATSHLPSVDSTALQASDASGYRRGVNLAGGEFYMNSQPDSIPGVYGTDYVYPAPKALDYYKSKGLTLIRLPFLWERTQRTLFGELDAAELSRLDGVVAAIQSRGMHVVLEPHNRAHRYIRVPGATGITMAAFHPIGSPEVPTAAFSDFWKKMAAHYKGNQAVYAVSLTDEPHDMQGLWPAAAQAGMDGVRAADPDRLVLVGGDGWSNAGSWDKANRDLDVKDPQGRFMYEASIFFDADSTGRYVSSKDASGKTVSSYDTAGVGMDIGVTRAKVFTAWLKTRHARGFFGGYGIPADDARWLTVLDRFFTYIDAEGMGGACWAGGPWWPANYPLSLEPLNGQDRPQMAILTKHLGSLR
ncbi:MAG TPA: cellulase family glycosylhydrolase [Stenomitos sp.]